MDKKLRNLFAELTAQGWTVRAAKKGWMAIPPDKSEPLVAIHGTARGARSWENMIAQLKRSGFELK